MLEMCTYHDLWITNTYFKTKPPLNVSWRQMRSEQWHQLGLILVSHDDLKNVLHKCSFHNANCNIDHSWRCCTIRLNVSKMRQLDLVEQFAEVFRKERDASNGLVTLPRWGGKPCEPCTVRLCLPLRRGPWRHTTGLRLSRPRWLPSSESRVSLLPRISRHLTKRTCQFSRPSGARSNSNRLPGAALASTGQSSTRASRLLPLQEILDECTMAKRRH